VANLSALRAESVTEIRSPHVFLVRTEKGVAALSTWCTHQHQQLVLNTGGQIACPAHKSIFDLTGTPRGGPANRPLPWYQTRVGNDGSVFVDTTCTVKQGQWAELPAWARPKE
jgi:Rieske Fe-S protein